jgi:DNA polymerase V
MFALIDCNNFYVSCERVFQPQFDKKPVVVLSNNDGCVISRSNEAKALEIPMGAAAFKYKNQFKKYNVKVFSSNYALYGDMSRRVMSILESYSPNIEIYSIDEAFLKLTSFNNLDITEESYKIKKQIYQWTGIPVSIGLAPSKSLAKIANKIAKKFNHQTLCVYSLDIQDKINKALKWTTIEDVWGVGRRYAKLLRSIGVKNALEFINLPDQWVKKNMNVLGLRLKKDLSGLSFIKLEEIRSQKKSIATTRSFESILTNLSDIEERVSTFATSCAEKLRIQNSCCTSLLVFVRSDPFKKEQQYSNSCVIQLSNASNSSLILSKQAIYGLRKIFKPGISYKKAGVLALGLTSKENHQLNIFEPNIVRHDSLMKAIDTINHRHGSNRIKLANQDLNRVWKMKQNNLSPKFTTVLEDIIKVK